MSNILGPARTGTKAKVPDSPPGADPTTGFTPSTYTPQQTPAVNRIAGDEVTASSFNQMLDVLNELVDHTHIFYDDYSTACNCNCACACTRGIL